MTTTTTNLGTVNLGGQIARFEFMTRDGSTQTDIYKFKISDNVKANVAIDTRSGTSSPFALALFQDRNNNGLLDNGDAPRLAVSDTGSGTSEGIESINQNLSNGTYFARAQSFPSENVLIYSFRLLRASSGSANPLTTPEIPLGTIAQDLWKTDRISDKDTADNFAFTLDGNSSLNIGVRELGSKKGDVNIRVVQDLNSNGFVDKNEVVAKGTSTRKGNVDTITGLNKAGDYILQVCQTKGNSQFAVNFDHSDA